MIPTKGSIQQTSEPLYQASQPPLTGLLLPTLPLLGGLVEQSGVVDEAQKATAQVFTRVFLHSSTEASFRKTCQRKGDQGGP